MIRIQYDVFVSILTALALTLQCATLKLTHSLSISFKCRLLCESQSGTDLIPFQFIVTPSNFEKPIKLQLPILLATYPLRNEDGTMRRKTKAEYPTTLPIFRPWLDEKNL